jgi:hypothetical protein
MTQPRFQELAHSNAVAASAGIAYAQTGGVAVDGHLEGLPTLECRADCLRTLGAAGADNDGVEANGAI